MYFEKMNDGYHFNSVGIEMIEKHYGGEYVGYFCTKRPDGSWNEVPVDVFYQPNPDISKGHSHYYGMFRRDDSTYITNAISVTEQPMLGIVANDGEVVVSRYRHDYRRSNDGSVFIDGGRDYTRYGYNNSDCDVGDIRPRLVRVRFMGSQLVVVE